MIKQSCIDLYGRCQMCDRRLTAPATHRGLKRVCCLCGKKLNERGELKADKPSGSVSSINRISVFCPCLICN